MEHLRNIPMIKKTREDNDLINKCKDGGAAFLFGYIPLQLTYTWVGIGIVQITYQDTDDIAGLQLHP